MRELLSIGPGVRQPGGWEKQLRIAVSGQKAQPDPSLLIPDLSVPLNFDDGPSVERTENKRRGSGGGATDVIYGISTSLAGKRRGMRARPRLL